MCKISAMLPQNRTYTKWWDYSIRGINSLLYIKTYRKRCDRRSRSEANGRRHSCFRVCSRFARLGRPLVRESPMSTRVERQTDVCAPRRLRRRSWSHAASNLHRTARTILMPTSECLKSGSTCQNVSFAFPKYISSRANNLFHFRQCFYEMLALCFYFCIRSGSCDSRILENKLT